MCIESWAPTASLFSFGRDLPADDMNVDVVCRFQMLDIDCKIILDVYSTMTKVW